MVPAQPPFPTARNLPFQFSAGSHTSTSICESDDGESVRTTRQCAGKFRAGCPRPPAKGPAATVTAVVTVAFASETDFKLSQGVAATTSALTTSIEAIIWILPLCGVRLEFSAETRRG